MNKDLRDRVCKMERYFSSEKYAHLLVEMGHAIKNEDWEGLGTVLDKFPTRVELFNQLLEQLSRPQPKGKPIYRSLMRLARGQMTCKEEKLKVYFSLGTHLSISIAKGDTEFRMLRDEAYNKIGELIYQ